MDAAMNHLSTISRITALCLLAVFVACCGYALNLLLAPRLIRAAADRLTAAQIVQRQADFAAAAPLAVEGLGEMSAWAFVKHDELLPGRQAAFAESFANGTSGETVVGLKLWDDAADDGDMVQIRSAGYSVTLLLSDVPRNVYIPVYLGVPVVIHGVRDGRGGGITVSVAAQRALSQGEASWQDFPRTGTDGQVGAGLALPLLHAGEAVEVLLRPEEAQG